MSFGASFSHPAFRASEGLCNTDATEQRNYHPHAARTPLRWTGSRSAKLDAATASPSSRALASAWLTIVALKLEDGHNRQCMLSSAPATVSTCARACTRSCWTLDTRLRRVREVKSYQQYLVKGAEQPKVQGRAEEGGDRHPILTAMSIAHSQSVRAPREALLPGPEWAATPLSQKTTPLDDVSASSPAFSGQSRGSEQRRPALQAFA